MSTVGVGIELVTALLRLLLAPVSRLLRWYRYRNVDHFEIRWRPPGGRGWRQVEPRVQGFTPSDLDEPISADDFRTHASTMGWYDGEYRLIGMRPNNQFGPTLWQEHLANGRAPEDDRRMRR